MAKKKTRRAPHSSTPRMYGDGKPSQTAQTGGSQTASSTGGSVATPARVGSARTASSTRAAVPLTEEYHYVIGDLKRLGIQAAITFAVLIALGLILR